MKKQDIFVPSGDGRTKLHGIIWEPEDGQIKAVVQLVHGMAEYIDRYHDFAVYLTEHGFAVIGHDHLGHGQSITGESELGFFAAKNGHRIVVEDMHRITEYGKKRWPGKPWFILGHSMGSFMTRRYLTHYSDELAGAVIVGTGWVPGVLAGVGKLMSNVIGRIRGWHYHSKLLVAMSLGSYNKSFAPARTDVDWLSRNEENVDRYVADKLCGFDFTTGAYRDFFTVLGELASGKDYEKIRRDLPILVTAGEKDPVGGAVAVPRVCEQYRTMGMKDVTMKIYADDRHEILNETDRDVVFADICGWLESKVDGRH